MEEIFENGRYGTRTLRYPPAFPTGLTPEVICGDLYPLFCRHYEKVSKANGPEDFEQKAKIFSQEERALVSSLLEELRRNGFYPTGIKQNGTVRFGVVTDEFGTWKENRGLPKGPFTNDEKKQMIRTVYRNLGAIAGSRQN